MQCNGGLVLNRDLLISSNVPSRSGCCPASPASPASPGRSKGSGARAQSPKPAAEAWHRERGVEARGAARERGERPKFRPALPRMAASKTSLPGFLEPPLHHGGRSTWDHRAMILGLPSLSELHTCCWGPRASNCPESLGYLTGIELEGWEEQNLCSVSSTPATSPCQSFLWNCDWNLIAVTSYCHSSYFCFSFLEAWPEKQLVGQL